MAIYTYEFTATVSTQTLTHWNISVCHQCTDSFSHHIALYKLATHISINAVSMLVSECLYCSCYDHSEHDHTIQNFHAEANIKRKQISYRKHSCHASFRYTCIWTTQGQICIHNKFGFSISFGNPKIWNQPYLQITWRDYHSPSELALLLQSDPDVHRHHR